VEGGVNSICATEYFFLKFLAFELIGNFPRRRRIACNSTNLSIHLVQQRFSSAYVRDGNSEK
jgi:hypothetical protein